MQQHIAKFPCQHIGRFGSPCKLCSDNDSHLIAHLVSDFLALTGTRRCLTLTYSKEENALVERMNKEANRHLRALTYDNLPYKIHKDSHPFVQRIINWNNIDRLKISAADFLFGKILNLDRVIFPPKTEQTSATKPLSSYASWLLKTQDDLYALDMKPFVIDPALSEVARRDQIEFFVEAVLT